MIDYMQLDDDELLDAFLESSLFTRDRYFTTNHTPTFQPEKKEIGIELIVRPECNQQCEYCYIYKHGKELYPLEERVNNATIIKNLNALLHYVFYEKQSFVTRWELFAGDMFFDNLIFDIFETFYNQLKPIYETYPHLFNSKEFLILIPCNCSFIADDNKVNLYHEWHAKLKSIGIKVILSYSSDGLYATGSREKKELDQAWYDKVFTFLSKYDYAAHPMISPENIENQKENIMWWREMWEKYFPNRSKAEFLPMFLEVRNDGWTFEKIQSFISLLDFTIDKVLEFYDNDIDKFTKAIFKPKVSQYRYYALMPYNFKEASRYSCSIQQLLHVTLNNLSIVPCHRTSYPQFKIGQFVLNEDNVICGVKANNISLGLTIFDFKATSLPKCVTCVNSHYCMNGCLGSQYETSGELFEPITSVCNLLGSKTFFLLQKYDALKIFDTALENNYISLNQYRDFKSQLERMKNGNGFSETNQID